MKHHKIIWPQKQIRTKSQHPNDEAYHTLPAQNHSTSVCLSPDVTQAWGLRAFRNFPCLLWQLSFLGFSLITIKARWEHKDNSGKCLTPPHLLWASQNGLLARLSLPDIPSPQHYVLLVPAKPLKPRVTVTSQQVSAEGPELRPLLAESTAAAGVTKQIHLHRHFQILLQQCIFKDRYFFFSSNTLQENSGVWHYT